MIHVLQKVWQTWGESQHPMLMDVCLAPTGAQIERNMELEEVGNPSMHGQTSWIASGIRIQELQYVHKYI